MIHNAPIRQSPFHWILQQTFRFLFHSFYYSTQSDTYIIFLNNLKTEIKIMTENEQLKQQLWNIANTLRGKMKENVHIFVTGLAA